MCEVVDVPSHPDLQREYRHASLSRTSSSCVLVAIRLPLYVLKQPLLVLQASHMIHSADDNGDKRLTLEEMLNNPYVFYSAAVDDGDEVWHDEF